MNCQHSQFLFTDTPVPRFSTQPYVVYTTPGLGNFFNDHFLYTPVKYHEENIKELEKSINAETTEGGFELNSPLIVKPLVSRKQKKVKNSSDSKTQSTSQKGHGKLTEKSAMDPEIEDALQHPIKVFTTN